MQSEMPSTQHPDVLPKEHLCLDCGIDISHRSRKALRCKPCSTNHESIRSRQSAKDFYWANRPRVLQRIKSYQQTPEAKRLRQEWEERNPEKLMEYRQRKKERHREKRGYNPEGRTCEDCGVDISHRGHNAKRCESCSTPPSRTCVACGGDLSHRGPRAQFCNEQCKQRDQKLKEFQGYTKRCTKCNETKEHTEFGLHYNRRRSVCKPCEVKSQSEHYQNLPVEERRKRRRVQGERERAKKANLPPEQKAILRTKARQAHRRRLYGSEFDEDRLYSAQEGKCAICRSSKSLEALEVDHDHATGTPRGFLCKNCNFKLLSRYVRFPVRYQDSPYLNAYLEKGQQQ